jgi:signal peptidase II
MPLWSAVYRPPSKWYNTFINKFPGGNLKQLRDYVGLFLTAGVVIFLDQWSKLLVLTSLAPSEQWLPDRMDWLMPYARIINWHNSGAAFGMFQGMGGVFTVLAFVVTALIIYYYPRVDARDWWLKLAMGMQMGGALGNVIDRLTRGQVTDFISVGSFPVFNVADSSISIGVAVLIIGTWVREMQERNQIQVAKAAESLSVESADVEGENTGG